MMGHVDRRTPLAERLGDLLRRKPGEPELDDLPRAFFDTVILNSVVQYFPDMDYLLDTIRKSADLVGSRGR